MTTLPTAMYYLGRPVTELSREELIDALEQMSRQYQAVLKDNAQRAEFLTSAIRRRGEELRRKNGS